MRISDWSSDVCSSDLFVERVVFVFTMIEARPIAGLAGDFLQMLVQGATKSDVQFLKTATDAKERYGARDAGANEIKRQRITLLGEQHAVARRGAFLMSGMNV